MARLSARRREKSFAGERGSFLFASLTEAAVAADAMPHPADRIMR
jgi:hypothetical protein